MDKCERCGGQMPNDTLEYGDSYFDVTWRNGKRGYHRYKLCAKCCKALGWWITLGKASWLEGG